MTTTLVTCVVDGRVGIVTMNRADKLNAISPDLKTALIERLQEADCDPSTSVVVLRAEGRSFSAGYDISPNPARAARKGNALGLLPRRRLRAGDDVRHHDRGGRRPVR